MNFSALFLAQANGRQSEVDALVDGHLRELLLDETLTTLRAALTAALRELKAAASELSWDAPAVEAAFGAYGRGVGRLFKLAEAEGLLPTSHSPTLTLVR